jgi:hypothetical protein
MSKPIGSGSGKLWSNYINKGTNECFMHHFAKGQNPFMTIEAVSTESNSELPRPISTFDSNPYVLNNVLNGCKQELYDKVQSFMTKSADEIILASKTALNGLARWTVRLQAIQIKLPLMMEQVERIICNLYDLYFLTVFRLCFKDGRSESIALGNVHRSDHIFQERFPRDLPPPQPRVGNIRQKVLSRTDSSHLISNFCDADINAPLKCKEDSTSKVQKFILRGQASLSSMVNLDRIESWNVLHDDQSNDKVLHSAKCMEKLIAASSSTLFVACLFDVCISGVSSDLDSPIVEYYKQMMDAICVMYNMCIRMCSTRAIQGQRVVSNVSGRSCALFAIDIEPSFLKVFVLH